MAGRGTSSKAQKLGANKAEMDKEIEIIQVDSNLFIHFLQLVKASSRLLLITLYVICFQLLFAGSQVHTAIYSSLPVIVRLQESKGKK